MKFLFRVVALVVVLIVLSGQAFGQNATPLPPEETNFTVWHPSGDMLLVTQDNIVRILDVTALENPIRTFQLEGRKLYAAPAWSPDGEMLALDNDSRLEIWEHPWDNSQTEPIAILTFENPTGGRYPHSPGVQMVSTLRRPVGQSYRYGIRQAGSFSTGLMAETLKKTSPGVQMVNSLPMRFEVVTSG